jgi:hypothetical protein
MYDKPIKIKHNALVPTLSEIILFPAVSFFVLCALTFGKLMKGLGLHINPVDLPGKLSELYEGVISIILPNIATALLWAVVGLGVYFIIWITIDSITKVNFIKTAEHRFIYPDEERRQFFIFTVAGHLYLRLVAFISLFVWFLFLLKITPLLSNYFYSDGWTLSLIVAPIVLGSYLFIAAPITRLVFLRPRVFSDKD